ncbi:MAG: DNA-formamidopyrimidine glycosylase family protein [Propionicimonas sp.]|uniref:DNA-formamidopyrimidine glycosylase family protein n=1 Tax=Propionicimonas sp. TaxID=1955623 RepID=UPI002B2140D9|nr:DNA-formamidopyrimidine glycosylase family protein [Propionicimonas sp.]MEA4943937.1 DNA-formamidopyrimidine glycosylase family protein [Propionicimonas sp.]
MPEGDAVWRTARTLDDALSGRQLLDADLRWPTIATARLAGMMVSQTVPRGKHLLTRLDSGWTLHSHLRMDGSWVIEPTGGTAQRSPSRSKGPPRAASRVPERRSGRRPESRGGGFVRAVLVGPDYTAIGVDLGMLDLVRTTEEHTLVGHLGPDLLDPRFDTELAIRNLVAAEGTIGAALLDQTNLAGIGTIWASETLFAERIQPWTPSSGLDRTTIEGLVNRARKLLQASLAGPLPSSTGSQLPGRNTWVHGRSGRQCVRCGGTIRVASIGPATRERPMFYCPVCQGGLGPTDDGRPAAPLGTRRQ